MIVINVAQEINHPSYQQATFYDGDNTVVRLQSSITYRPVIAQVSIISHGSDIPDNMPVVHAGWGTTSSQGPFATQLLDVTIYTVNHDVCVERYSTSNVVTENMICAGILDVGGKDTCQGDSGGPLYFGDILIGVVSWGGSATLGCADPYLPGVSARVASYTNWIMATVV